MEAEIVPEKNKSKKIKKRKVNKRRNDKKSKIPYADVRAKVDTSAPLLDLKVMPKKLHAWAERRRRILDENLGIVMAIKKTYDDRGKVDSYWDIAPRPTLLYYYNRVNFLSRINFENQYIYKRIVTAAPRVQSTAELLKDWERNKREMFELAENDFVLFPPYPVEDVEDPDFLLLPGVKRPRVYLTLSHYKCAPMGEIAVELFTDICPKTCELFTDLLMGDGLGYGYVGTSFFRKVPNLYWAGGDVIYNNGYGCYAQKGRCWPIGAENYVFKHTMPGLLSMRMTCDDEMCGSFNITFKPLPQFDYKNVVFGRVIRPSEVFNSMKAIGNPLSTHPTILLAAARRRVQGKWVYGVATKNTLNLPGTLSRKKLLRNKKVKI